MYEFRNKFPFQQGKTIQCIFEGRFPLVPLLKWKQVDIFQIGKDRMKVKMITNCLCRVLLDSPLVSGYSMF